MTTRQDASTWVTSSAARHCRSGEEGPMITSGHDTLPDLAVRTRFCRAGHRPARPRRRHGGYAACDRRRPSLTFSHPGLNFRLLRCEHALGARHSPYDVLLMARPLAAG